MIKTPRISTGYQLVYLPGADAFPGPDSEHLAAGKTYDDWIANDHTFIKGKDGLWHVFGIVAPACETLHEGTWMAFHASSPAASIEDSLKVGLWTEHPKVLPPSQRPGERKELWAPFIVEEDGLYHMFYGPCEMRRAVSRDLFEWEPKGAVFEQAGHARDPWIIRLGGSWAMVYVAGSSVFLRESGDLTAWGEPVEIFPMDRPGAPESPMMIELAGAYYLLWTIHDGTHGSYDHRTYVFRSENPRDFRNAVEIAELPAHAPELVHENGQWNISSVEWPSRGVSLARLEWE